MERQYFNQALSDFISDAAYGGAVRHLAALGHTVGQIVQELDFPISEDRAGAVVWRYYLEEGIILLDEPLNYMDVYFRRQLESAVLESEPTLMFVEHDEGFGRRVANKVIEMGRTGGSFRRIPQRE